jgi:hypothetical protein
MKPLPSSYSTIDLDSSFFGFLLKKMNPMPTKKIIKTLHFVLISLLHNQSAKKMNQLIKKLSPTLQLVFTGCWQDSFSKLPPAYHLDELVENIYIYRDAKKELIFNSRVEVLGAVLVIIKALKMVFENIGINILPHSMELEYQQAAMEDAA